MPFTNDIPEYWMLMFQIVQCIFFSFGARVVDGYDVEDLSMVRFGGSTGQIPSSWQNNKLCRNFRVEYGSVRVNSNFGSTFE